MNLGDGDSNLFKAKEKSMGYEKTLWPYLTIIFLIALVADVAARKLISFS